MGARAHLQLLRASGRALFISERHLRIDFRSSPGWRIRRKKANREEQYRDPQERHCIDHAEAEEQNMERVRRADRKHHPGDKASEHRHFFTSALHLAKTG